MGFSAAYGAVRETLVNINIYTRAFGDLRRNAERDEPQHACYLLGVSYYGCERSLSMADVERRVFLGIYCLKT